MPKGFVLYSSLFLITQNVVVTFLQTILFYRVLITLRRNKDPSKKDAKSRTMKVEGRTIILTEGMVEDALLRNSIVAGFFTNCLKEVIEMYIETGTSSLSDMLAGLVGALAAYYFIVHYLEMVEKKAQKLLSNKTE